jgi:hypothetical protein
MVPADNRGAATVTADDISERIYDACRDRQRGQNGVILPTSPLSLAARILADVLEEYGMHEGLFAPTVLGESIAYIIERVRPLLPPSRDWETTVLDDASVEIVRHVKTLLQSAAP